MNNNRALLTASLFLACVFFLWNCEFEETEKLTINGVPEANFRRSILSEHYLEFHKPNVYNTLKSLSSKINEDSKNQYSEEYNFEYNLTRVQMIETESFTQYSLLVKGASTDDTHFENYVLMEYANGNQLQFLFIFERIATENGHEIDHQKTQIQLLSGEALIGSRCQGGYELVDVEVMSGCFEIPCTGTNLHMPGEYCPCGITYHNCLPPKVTCSYNTVQQWRPCSSGNENPNDPNDPQTGGGSDNNNTEEPTNDEMPVIPLEETAVDRILNCMNSFSINEPNIDVPQSWQDSLSLDRFCNTDLDNFLSDNGCDFNSKGFVLEAFRACQDDIDYDDQIINKLEGKAKCTYDKLQNNSILRTTLSRFIGYDTPVNLLINQKSNLRRDDNDPSSPVVNAKTYYGESNTIIIILNTEQSNNRPSLALARTILHEVIHAEIFRKIKTTSGLYFDSVANEWKLPNGSRAHFPSLFDSFNEDPDNPYHNYMANYYRDAMIQGLKEYADLIGESNSDDFYQDFVWNSMLDTEAWESQYADQNYANSEKNRIINVITNYEQSGNNECE